jgi:DMSO/TMAO reductase YedYZ molybdopterin-dependent catalytic subunit
MAENGEKPAAPGQYYIKNWIIYAVLGAPRVPLASWRLVVDGLVKRPIELSFKDITSRKAKELRSDFDCVTHWSIKDVSWKGTPLKDLIREAGPLPEAAWVMFGCWDGYTTPVALEDALSDDAIIAYEINGKPLRTEQGFPVRPYIEHLYGWKSAKWLNKISLISEYKDGYWEAYGYHERGNKWNEERFNKWQRVKKTVVGMLKV